MSKQEPLAYQWIELTDQEIDAAWRSVDYTVAYDQFRIDIARAIEAKLKEKNGFLCRSSQRPPYPMRTG